MVSKITETENIFYRKSSKHDWLVVPSPNERKDIMEKYHLFGHFQAVSTYNRVRVVYYWSKMFKDIVDFVAKYDMKYVSIRKRKCTAEP